MGQINATPGAEAENGGEPGANYIAGVPNGEDDSRSSNVSVEGSQTPMEAVHCVKTRIDMLIEDCLNVRDSSGEDSNKDEKSVTNNSAQCDKSPDKGAVSKEGEGSENSKQADDPVIVDDSGTKVTECNEKVSNTAAEIGNQNGGKNEQDGKKTPDKEVKPEGNYSVEIKSESKTEKKAESKEGAHRHNRTVTTFQTFIDKVLDSSLKQVPDQENGSTNILKLCQESMQPNAEASKPIATKTTASDSVTKPKFDRASTKIKPERKITLKDHIERFLESSFRDEIGVHEKGSAESNDRKKEVSGAKNGLENFNAQGLVNNMITQGLQINKLLSPPIVVNHSKNPQRVPDIRVCTEYQRNEFMKNQMKEIKSEKHLQNVPYRSDTGVMRNNGYQNTGPRGSVPGEHPAQLSPGQISVGSNEGNKHLKDIRANHHVRMPDDGRRDCPFSRHYPADYNPEILHSHHRSVPHPGFHPGVDHNIPVTTLDQQMHGAMYPMAYPARTSVNTAQFPPVAMQQTGVSEEQRSPHGRPSHHHPHCMCPICISHQRQTLDVRDPKKDYSSQRRSPNIPAYMVSHEHQLQMRGPHLDSSQGMMRPSNSKMPPCPSAAYQTMPKLLPQQPPITSTKEYGSQLLVPGIGYPQGRRPSLPENSAQKPFSHQGRGGEYSHTEQPEDFARRMDAQSRGGNHSPYPVRPSSMPSHEHSSHQGGMFMRQSPAISDSGSHSSDVSLEAPLDLTVKKPKKDIERPRSSSYGSGAQHSQSHKKLNPSNTFLRHLENSVDKYCQELSGPMESPGKHIRQQMNRSLTPNESKHVLQYPAQSPRLPSPHNVYNLQHRKLPSPQFTGGITMGQPLVESRSQQVQRSVEMQYTNTAPLQVSQTSTVPAQNSQVAITTAPANFDMNSKRNINSISKHEPIQNIIGNHDPNDILYLICTICTQTYGSPYGFRKHFRNQHGFEPRAEHTIVQTISATKTALHGPIPVSVATSDYQSPHTISPPVIKSEINENSAIVVQSMNPNFDRKSSSGSPPNRKSPGEVFSEPFEENSGNDEKSKKIAQGEISERRCLECPECGKTFQLNDFGSYKRHCRQHNTVKVTGPYTCSDCHLSFPDQKALKEHHLVHYNESHVSNSDTSKVGENVNSLKTASPGNCFGCVKCDKQFTNMAAYNSHVQVHEQPPKLSPQIELNSKTDTAAAHSVALSSNTLSVIPSQCIVKQAAESMTAQVCPDSSWDDSNKSIPTPVDEKQDENTIENSDSGYSSSVGSNTMLNLDDNKLNENFEKKPAASVTRQKSLDYNSGSNEELQSSEDNFVYKHKKFSQHRKREISSFHSSDSTPSKQAKISTCQEIGPPVSSSTTSCVGYKCDSSEAEDTKSVDKLKHDSVESSDITTTKEAMFVDKQIKDVNIGKGEARHNLPFVWDRTTRSQRKTK